MNLRSIKIKQTFSFLYILKIFCSSYNGAGVFFWGGGATSPIFGEMAPLFNVYLCVFVCNSQENKAELLLRVALSDCADLKLKIKTR